MVDSKNTGIMEFWKIGKTSIFPLFHLSIIWPLSRIAIFPTMQVNNAIGIFKTIFMIK